MKNSVLLILLAIVVVLGAWYLLDKNKPKTLEQLVQRYVSNQATPTPTMPPKQEINYEIQRMEQELEQNNPEDFSGEALLDVNLGL